MRSERDGFASTATRARRIDLHGPSMIDSLISSIAFVFALVVFVPASILAIEVFGSALRRRPSSTGLRPGRIVVLIPAHDEGAGLLDTLRTVLPQMKTGDRCLVIADNCSDDTAAVARHAGADVIERFDAIRRGKGYALDYGIASLAASPPDAVVMVDADCRIAPDGIGRLAALCVERQRPVQALYLMRAGTNASPNMRIAEFAWRIKNHVRPLGLERLGLPCQLMGSGMGFSWSVLRKVDLASGSIVEDMKLGIDLAAQGHAPVFCEDVLVNSSFPSHADGARAQRTRWEHGHLGVLFGQVPQLIVRAIGRRDGLLLALAVDLIVPPIAMLVMLAVVTTAVTSITVLVTGSVAPWVVSVASLALISTAIARGWWSFGRESLPLRTLMYVPWYAICKVPLYARFLVKRQAEWVRSKRDP